MKKRFFQQSPEQTPGPDSESGRQSTSSPSPNDGESSSEKEKVKNESPVKVKNEEVDTHASSFFADEHDIYEVSESGVPTILGQENETFNDDQNTSLIISNQRLDSGFTQATTPDSTALSILPPTQTNGNESSSNSNQSISEMGYELFKSQITPIIGDAPVKVLKHLFNKYFNRPNYIQLATDEYFSGILYENEPSYENNMALTGNANISIDLSSEPENPTEVRDYSEIEISEYETGPWKRYIGSLDVEAWATRPYMGWLNYQQPLEVKRLTPNKIKKSSLVAAKFGDSAVIRLYTIPDGREIGRLREDITRILAPLMDLGIANFEAYVIMETRKRLSIGDSFYIQIRCFLNNHTFTENPGLTAQSEDGESEDSPAKRRKWAKPNGFNVLSETESEAVLRLKQKSISKLFERLHIGPANAPQKEKSIMVDDSDESPSATPQPDANLSPAEELNLDQLKEFYSTNQQSAYLENLPETTTPPAENFALNLRPYQKHGLAWMLSREKEMDRLRELSTTEDDPMSTQRMETIRQQEDGVANPLWKEFRWPKDRRLDGTVIPHENKSFYANIYSGEFSLHRPIMRNFLQGGILADEMGLGKTISTLALIHSVPYDSESAPVGFRNYASKSTLIIVPMSLLSQWKSEFDRTNNNKNHSCYVYYNESAQADLSYILCNRTENVPIVVITTYGTVQNEWTRLNKIRDDSGRLPQIGLYSVEFFRIVLDEGHTIRNRTTKTSKSIHELESRRKWILTGTPVVNRLDDIFSLVKFLKLDPWSNFSYWKTFVTLPFEQKQFHQTLDVVKSILQPVFLRRTKNMKSKDGKPLVSLPSKEIVIQELELSDKEQMVYDFFKSRAHQSFTEGMRTGELLKKYTQILTHILRLRQVCCHSDLIAGSNELDESWHQELEQFQQPVEKEKFESETVMKQVMYGLYKSTQIEDSECSICTSAPIPIGELTVTECGHQYCFHCLLDHINYQKNEKLNPLCPQCRHPISKYRLFKVNRREVSKKEVRFHTNEETSDPYGSYDFQLYYFDPDRSSAKIQALVAHLRELKEQSPGESVVVFSQFSTFLDLIENEIKSLGTEENQDFVVYKFDGRLSMADREKILSKFTTQNKADKRITVLLLSLKAGGVGLNLTVARRAFMMDPWWSPSIEDQAIDRVHRIGQENNVKVVRFIVKNSIETKMLRIQERKRKMGEAVEVEEEERRKQRIEEIKLLFDE